MSTRSLAVGCLLITLLSFLITPLYASNSEEPISFIPWFESTDKEYVTLKIEVVGKGDTIPPSGVYRVKRGVTVTIQVADVGFGYEFDHWEVNFVNYGYAPFKTITLEGDAVVKAVFTAAPTSEESGYLVVDLVFYDNPMVAPVGNVLLWELGVNKPLKAVQITSGQWHSQVVFKGVRVGKTYTVIVQLKNGVEGIYMNFWTIYSKSSYLHWGFIYHRRKMHEYSSPNLS